MYVCLSRQSSIETDAPIELVFGCLRPLRYCVESKFGYIQNKGISFWNLVANSWLRKNFAKCCQLSSTKMDAQCDILPAAVGRTKLTIPATVDVNGCVTLSAHIRVHHYALMHSPRCYGSINYYSASGREAECCEEHVCLSVCPWCCFDNFQSKIIACVQSLLPVLRCPRASVDWWRHYRRWWQFQSLWAIRLYRLPQQIKWQAPMSSYWPLVVTMVLFHFFRNNDNKNSSVSRRLWPLMMADEH